MNSELFRDRAILICPGMHDPQLTQDFLKGLQDGETGNLLSQLSENALIFPIEKYPAYSATHILEFLQDHIGSAKPPLVVLSFSAGVAGAIGAAWGWQVWGGTVKAFFAFDGWGVPLYGNFPIHRISHDYFTHWSSALLGGGDDSFYAEPAVEHLDLWRKPSVSKGWRIHLATDGKQEQRTYTTATDFVNQLLQRYIISG